GEGHPAWPTSHAKFEKMAARPYPKPKTHHQQKAPTETMPVDRRYNRCRNSQQFSHHPRNRTHHCVALVAAVGREGPRIDTRGEDLSATCQYDAVWWDLPRHSRKDVLQLNNC